MDLSTSKVRLFSHLMTISSLQTIANRIIEITPNGIIDKQMTYDEYLEDSNLQKQVASMYA